VQRLEYGFDHLARRLGRQRGRLAR
jgi:hypothetical protein